MSLPENFYKKYIIRDEVCLLHIILILFYGRKINVLVHARRLRLLFHFCCIRTCHLSILAVFVSLYLKYKTVAKF